MTPFEENIRSAEDIELELRGTPIQEFVGETLQLNSVSFEESTRFGWLTSMECETEDGTPVKVASWSEVVYRQANKMKDSLPVLISPRKVANYFTLY